MSREKVAVVGGTGFLGSHLVERLSRAGYAPVVVARTPDKLAKVLSGIHAEVRQGDMTDLESLRTALQGCDVVFSVASLVSQIFASSSRDKRDKAIQTNVDGTLNILRAALEDGARRVVVTGSSGTRYQPGGALANEDSPPTGLRLVGDAYVESKLLEEEAIADFAQETGLDVVQVLPGGMVGPRDVGPSLLGGSILACLNGSRQSRATLDGGIPIVDVRDAAQAHLAAMEQGVPGAAYLMVARTIPSREWQGMLSRLTGLPQPRFFPASMAMSIAFLVEIMARVSGRAPWFTRDMVRHVVICQQYDCSRAMRELGITFRPVESSLRDTILWYVDNGWVDEPERLALVATRAEGGTTREEIAAS